MSDQTSYGDGRVMDSAHDRYRKLLRGLDPRRWMALASLVGPEHAGGQAAKDMQVLIDLGYVEARKKTKTGSFDVYLPTYKGLAVRSS